MSCFRPVSRSGVSGPPGWRGRSAFRPRPAVVSARWAVIPELVVLVGFTFAFKGVADGVRRPIGSKLKTKPYNNDMAGTLSPNEESQLALTIEMFGLITQSQPQDYQSLEILKEAYVKLGRDQDAVNTSRRIGQAYVQQGCPPRPSARTTSPCSSRRRRSSAGRSHSPRRAQETKAGPKNGPFILVLKFDAGR